MDDYGTSLLLKATLVATSFWQYMLIISLEDSNTRKTQRDTISYMFNVKATIRFGIYTCIVENSSFKAIFIDMEIAECKWLAYNGQQSDEE